ncbi:MAG: cache domain-containing protein, partial [Erysipelotrichales bacterium]|nr:cache domain-containing protein [Erysipelotrichales bacterium]
MNADKIKHKLKNQKVNSLKHLMNTTKGKIINKLQLNSIRSKILRWSIAFIVIPLIAVGIITTFIILDVLEKKVSETNLQTVVQARENLDFLMQELEKSLNIIIYNDDIRSILKNKELKTDSMARYRSRDTLEKVTKNFLSTKSEIVYINLSMKNFEYTSMYGIVSYAFEKLNLYYIDDGQFYKELKRKGNNSCWFDEVSFLNNHMLKNCIYFAKIIYDENTSNELGILTIGIDKDALSEYLKEDNTLETRGLMAVATNEKQILPLSNSDNGLERIIAGSLNIKDNSYEKSFKFTSDGKAYLASFSKSQYSGWNVVNIIPIK